MEMEYGRLLGDGEHVLHLCDNPCCIEIDHLRVGSHSDNMRDISRRGRAGGLKLSDEDVTEIRRLKTTGMKQCLIAERFGVSDSRVSMIVNNRVRPQ